MYSYKCRIFKNAEKLYFVKFFIPVSRNNISVITQLQEKMQYIVNVVAFLCTFDVHALQKLSRYTLVSIECCWVFFQTRRTVVTRAQRNGLSTTTTTCPR